MKITNALDIPGETTTAQHEWFNKVYHWIYPPRRILEIGCAWGRSSWAWLDCIEHKESYLEILDNWAYNNSPDKIKIYNNTYYNEIKKTIPDFDQKKIIEYNLQQNKNYNKLKKIHTGTTDSFIKENNIFENFDIVFLDGDHSEKNVYKELNYFKGLKIICGDDFASAQPGVIKAVCRFHIENFEMYKLYTDPDARFFVFKRIDL